MAELKFLRKNKKAKIILNNRDKTYKMEILDGEYSYGIVEPIWNNNESWLLYSIKGTDIVTNIFVRDIYDIGDNYLFNYSRICFWDKYKVHYPSLNKFIERHLNKLQILLDEGVNGLYKNYKDASIFSVSLEFLANNIGISKKTLSPVINIFTAIGLIEKVDNIKEKKTSYNNITYYRIPRWTENVLNEADYLCSKFLELNVSPTKVTAKHIAKVLGKETTLKIMRDHKARKLLAY